MPGHTGARIKVVGVGGGGSNAVNRMVRSGLDGVEYIVANTDAQALSHTAPRRSVCNSGGKLTKGLGAGADPNVGRQAALEDTEQIISALDGADMVFVTTGWAGARGPARPRSSRTWPASWVRSRWRWVTKPFAFEGTPPRQAGGERSGGVARSGRHRHYDSERTTVVHDRSVNDLVGRVRVGR